MNPEPDDTHLNVADISLKVTKDFNQLIEHLTFLWTEYGFPEAEKKNRLEVIYKCMSTIMNELKEEENNHYNALKMRIDLNLIQEQKLREMLSLSPVHHDFGSMGLLDKEKQLRTLCENLEQQKHIRIRALRDLRKVEKKYCLLLNLPEHELSSATGVPSENDLYELEQHVNMLKDERERRYRKFCLAKKELTTIMETTELNPDTTFERDVMCYSDESFVLSDENLDELESFVKKIQKKKIELEEQKNGLINILVNLYKRLSISSSEKDEFLSKHDDCRTSTLEAIHQEIERCEEIKKQNLQKYIDSLRKELEELWELCGISEAEKNQFISQHMGHVTEETLTAYEEEVRKIKKHYEEISGILKKIKKREELWCLMISFEGKANDPNRFTNRGGNLLQEEKERKKIQKELPQLENELFKMIDEYQNCGKLFLYRGVSYQDYINTQWEERINEKENQKLLRHKKDALLTPTPSKRFLTPKSAHNKIPKPFSSPFSPRVAINFKTPKITMKPKFKDCKTPSALPVNKNADNHADGTTYSEFASELNKPSRKKLRSSVLVAKRRYVSRTSHNNKWKSLAKAVKQQSKEEKGKAPMATPVGGKSGLPFLI